MSTHEGLPVSGYRPQSEEAVGKVNENKQLEEIVLQWFDLLAADTAIDKHWLAIGRIDIERGFMAVNRAIFQPERVKLIGADL